VTSTAISISIIYYHTTEASVVDVRRDERQREKERERKIEEREKERKRERQRERKWSQH